jgi:hypothetical protein
MSKVITIRVSVGFTRLSDANLLARGGAIYNGLTGNPAYPNPPLKLDDLRSALDRYSAATIGALDGSKRAKIERDKQRGVVLSMLRQLGHYAEANCKNDLVTLLSSGFEVKNVSRSTATELSRPGFRQFQHGVSGQLLASVTAAKPKPANHEIRFRPLGSGDGGWATVAFTNARTQVAINNLTPGVVYEFQIRALGRRGYTDFSNSVTQMAT